MDQPNNETQKEVPEEQLTLKQRREKRRAEKLERRAANAGQKGTSNRFLLWLFVVIILVGVVLAMVNIAKKSDTPIATTVLESVSGEDWIRDNAQASTTLIEYSDFECPACASYHPALKQIHNEFGSKIRFVYRHFPLQQHTNARIAARAAEAAGKQGKFWEMHDMLFEKQKDWAAKPDAEEIFTGYATALKLDIEKWKQDYRIKEIGDKIDAQYQSGVKYGVSSTPTFYVNNTKYTFKSFEELRITIKDTVDGKIN